MIDLLLKTECQFFQFYEIVSNLVTAEIIHTPRILTETILAKFMPHSSLEDKNEISDTSILLNGHRPRILSPRLA